MGNRGVIVTENRDLGVYVHWYGDPDTVAAFLLYCKLKGFRPPEEDPYGWACLVTVFSNMFMRDGEGIGVDVYESLDLDNWDNGYYVIKDWEIIQMSRHQEIGEIDDVYLDLISSHQPKHLKLDQGVLIGRTYDTERIHQTDEQERQSR